jgi:putative membrane protein
MTGGVWMGAGMIWMFLLLVGLVLLIVWLVQSVQSRSREPRQQDGREDDALGIARDRYAKGEITKEQYEQIERDLKKGN